MSEQNDHYDEDDKGVWGDLIAWTTYNDGWIDVKVCSQEGQTKSHRFIANYEPRFGVDVFGVGVSDMIKIGEIAEKLAQMFDNENN